MKLNAKVTLTLTAVFAVSVGAFLVFLVPFLGEQRATLLDKDQRLLSTLRDNYARDFIYDLLSENEDSLAIHLANLAGQRGLLWARASPSAASTCSTPWPSCSGTRPSPTRCSTAWPAPPSCCSCSS